MPPTAGSTPGSSASTDVQDLTDVDRALLEAWGRGLYPDRRLLPREWAETNIVLPQQDSSEPGPIRLDRTPYLIEPLNNLSPSSSVWKTSAKKGRQLGFTTVGSCFLGYVIDHMPGPMLYATATLDLARKTSTTRLKRLIEQSEALRRKVVTKRSSEGTNTQLVKEYPGGVLAMVGANSAASLRSWVARFGFADEVDAWPLDLDDEGDPLELFLGRFDTFGRKKKILIASTPTNEDGSRIEREYLKGDQRHYQVPCIKCGCEQTIEFSRLVGPLGAPFSSNDPPEHVFLECESCNRLIPEHEKEEFLPAGRWLPTVERPVEPGHRSYFLPSWYSPLGWFSWRQGVHLFLEAKRKNDEAKLKVWTNQIAAETWKEKRRRSTIAVCTCGAKSTRPTCPTVV